MQDTPTEAQPTLGASIRQALRGSHDHDYTSGPLGRAILLLAIPMVLEMSMESVFFFVSQVDADTSAHHSDSLDSDAEYAPGERRMRRPLLP